MRWSLTLGSIAGTAVRIHVTFLLFLLFIGVSEYQSSGGIAALDALVYVVLIFACVTAHEFGHVLMADRFGVKTTDITLFPIGGVASMEQIPEKPSQELLIALAGPAVNIVIAILILSATRMTVETIQLADLANGHIGLTLRLAIANLALGLFNLLPAFPMDGGRVLRALLATKFSHTQATRYAAVIGQGLAFVLGFAGLFGNPMLIFIAVFIYIAASAEAEAVMLRDLTRDLMVADAMVTGVSPIFFDDRISAATDALIGSPHEDFPVVDDTGMFRGFVTRGDIITALNSSGPEAPVSSIIRPMAPRVSPWDKLEKAMKLIEGRPHPVAIVIDDEGAIAGILTRQSIMQVAAIHAARPDWHFHRNILHKLGHRPRNPMRGQ